MKTVNVTALYKHRHFLNKYLVENFIRRHKGSSTRNNIY